MFMTGDTGTFIHYPIFGCFHHPIAAVKPSWVPKVKPGTFDPAPGTVVPRSGRKSREEMGIDMGNSWENHRKIEGNVGK